VHQVLPGRWWGDLLLVIKQPRCLTLDANLGLHACRFDPAVTSVPFMTTIVDSTGLVIYFYIAKWMLGIYDPAS
jgi:hypothetical protein